MSEFTLPGGSIELAGYRVARIGFGAMQLEKLAEGTANERALAASVLRRASESGVNHIDTAQFYGDGVANALIREALSPYDEDLLIATKVGARRESESGRLVAAQKPQELRVQVEQNLASLGTERLGIVNLRRADAQPGIIAEGDQVVDLDDQLAELTALRDEGKIDGIGLSNVSVAQLGSALPAGIVAVQNAYNLLLRTDDPLLETCRLNGVAWVPFFPLGSGFPGQHRVTDSEVVIDIAASLGVTAAQVGLAWLLANYSRTLLIPGTSSIDHLAENVAAGDVHLDEAVMAKLETAVVG